MFDFDDSESDVRGKELKRETLVELAEYVNLPVGQKIFTEAIMPDIVEMVRINLFRTLPPQTEDFDPEEDEPAMEVMWPHLQVNFHLHDLSLLLCEMMFVQFWSSMNCFFFFLILILIACFRILYLTGCVRVFPAIYSEYRSEW